MSIIKSLREFDKSFFEEVAHAQGKDLRIIHNYIHGQREIKLFDVGLYFMVCIFKIKDNHIIYMSSPISSKFEAYVVFNKKKKWLFLQPYPIFSIIDIVLAVAAVVLIIIITIIIYV